MRPTCTEVTGKASSWEAARTVALLHVGLRRLSYAARFIYWTLRHGSTQHVAWVLAFEGY